MKINNDLAIVASQTPGGAIHDIHQGGLANKPVDKKG